MNPVTTPDHLTAYSLDPVIHGAPDHAELEALGVLVSDIIDFSSNCNPYGPHPSVIAAVRDAADQSRLARYPDPENLALRRAIAEADGVRIDAVLPGNGVAELIQTTAAAFVQADHLHMVLSPTFGEYAHAIRIMGGRVCEERPPLPDLCFDLDSVCDSLRRRRPQVVWLCNPNNPTGQQWGNDYLQRMRAAAPDALWIIDEAYRHFTLPPQPSPPASWLADGSLILLRSLTKDYSLAGLRLGYALASPARIRTLRAAQPPWSVNVLAQTAGVATLQPHVRAWRRQSLARLHRSARTLWSALRALGVPVLPTATTYALLAVENATEVRRRLLRERILVRDGTSFGLPDHIRCAARTNEDNQRLLQAIQAILR